MWEIVRGVFQQKDAKNGRNEVAGDFQPAAHMFTGKNCKIFYEVSLFQIHAQNFTDKKEE